MFNSVFDPNSVIYDCPRHFVVPSVDLVNIFVISLSFSAARSLMDSMPGMNGGQMGGGKGPGGPDFGGPGGFGGPRGPGGRGPLTDLQLFNCTGNCTAEIFPNCTGSCSATLQSFNGTRPDNSTRPEPVLSGCTGNCSASTWPICSGTCVETLQGFNGTFPGNGIGPGGDVPHGPGGDGPHGPGGRPGHGFGFQNETLSNCQGGCTATTFPNCTGTCDVVREGFNGTMPGHGDGPMDRAVYNCTGDCTPETFPRCTGTCQADLTSNGTRPYGPGGPRSDSDDDSTVPDDVSADDSTTDTTTDPTATGSDLGTAQQAVMSDTAEVKASSSGSMSSPTGALALASLLTAAAFGV